MRVYLVQHGESKTEEEDPERPLSEKGAKEVRSLAKSLSGRIKPSRICSSEKLRARQTAEIFAKELGVKKAGPEAGLAPNDGTETAMGLLADGVMIVGHLPHLSKLASRLLVRDESTDIVKFQYGGVLCLEKEEERWHLVFYELP